MLIQKIKRLDPPDDGVFMVITRNLRWMVNPIFCSDEQYAKEIKKQQLIELSNYGEIT